MTEKKFMADWDDGDLFYFDGRIDWNIEFFPELYDKLMKSYEKFREEMTKICDEFFKNINPEEV